DAGCYDSRSEESAMHRTSGRAVSQLFYGANLNDFYVRLDPEAAKGGAIGADWDIHVIIQGPQENFEVMVQCQANACATTSIRRANETQWKATGRACRGTIVEIAIPWDSLRFSP